MIARQICAASRVGADGGKLAFSSIARSATAFSNSDEKKKKVCLVVGAGSGIGANVARKFAKEGYRTVVIRRSDSQKLEALRAAICEDDAGGDQDACRAFLLDVTKEGELARVVDEVEAEFGEIECAVYNL